jgi:branched-subunit amino acid transport protein
VTDSLTLTVITVSIAAGSLAMRAVFILLAGRHEMPPRLQRALSFVPAAMFSGLIVATVHPERIAVAGDPALPRILALGLAAVVAARTKSILWTILAGMCAMWLLEWLLGMVGR